MVESVIARRHIIMAPAQLPCIGREDTDIEARIECACEEGDGKLVIVGHIELEEARSLAIGFADFLNWIATGCAEGIRQVELFGYFGDGDLAVFVVYFVDSYWSETDGGRHCLIQSSVEDSRRCSYLCDRKWWCLYREDSYLPTVSE